LVKSRFEEFQTWVAAQQYPAHIVANSLSIMNSVVDYMNAEDYHPRYWEWFVMYTSKLDNLRGQNILDIVPEFGDHI
jgi:hypothetical protein